ncbi:MAG TPA: ABC transporter permease [Candidatus Saccharimonadales bacterium]|nr:ABC transporter permease [Candidatus Saccharimonadales bacterium]
MKKAFLPIITFIPMDIKRLFRDKVAIFFVFVFPLIFLLIFGSIFGNADDVSFRVGLVNQSSSEFAGEFAGQINENEVFNVDKEAATLDDAREKMNRGQLDATIVLPEGFGAINEKNYPAGEVKILYDENNASAGQTLGSIMDGILKEINNEFIEIQEPLSVTAESTATKGLTQFDYVFSGLLGFTLLSLGIFGPTTVFPRLKQRGVLRRYHTTTLKVWQYFTANVVSNAVVGLIAVAVMFAAAFLIFDLNMRGDYLNLGIVVILGTILLFGIGLAIGGWAKNENQAAPISQLVVLPMMFLSGVFFPTFLMPELLQNITKFIPLTPIVDSVRYVVTEGKTVLELGPELTIILGWTLLIYLIAFRAFRWE